MRKFFLPAAIALALLAPLRAQQSEPVAPIARAVVNAVIERMGSGAEVTLASITPAFARPFSSLQIDPSAKLGAPVPVNTVLGPGRTMRLTAAFSVVVDYVCAARPLAAGQLLGTGDLTPVHGVVAGVPLRRLPVMAQLVGARTLRAIGVGEVMQSGFAALVPAVKAGEAVIVVARIGGVEARARLVAVDNGAVDDIIRIVNPDTRRTLRARVISAGIVEVLNVQ